MNRTLSFPKLAGAACEFQVGDDANPESIHVAPMENGSFSFQVNPPGGKELLNKKHSRPQRVSMQNEMALFNTDTISVSIKWIGGRPDLGSSCKSSRPCLMN
jgi:hypothetical protein